MTGSGLCRAALVVFGILALSWPAQVAANDAAPIRFDARADFRVSPNEANPSGTWSYGLQRTGGRVALLQGFFSDHFGVAGLETWHGGQRSTGPRDRLPWVGTNRSGADADPFGVDWRAGAMLAHPGAEKDVVIMWRSPGHGRLRISGRLVDRHPDRGDGISWVIKRRGRERLASGRVANGGATAFSPAAHARLGGVRVIPNTVIMLRIGAGPSGDIGCDSTEVALRLAFRPGHP